MMNICAIALIGAGILLLYYAVLQIRKNVDRCDEFDDAEKALLRNQEYFWLYIATAVSFAVFFFWK